MLPLAGTFLLIFCCDCGLVVGIEEEIETDNVAALARVTYKHENYNRNALPLKRKGNVSRDEDRIVVNMGFSIRQIHDINEFHQIMVISVWQREYWIDDYMTWNPDDYRGVKSIRVGADDIWTPGLVLTTSGSKDIKPMMDPVRIIVTHKGEVTYAFPILYHVACEMDMR